ncbi:MAG: exopolysaccharide biosynthesis protein [Pseudomonadota bacterium]
MSDRPAQDTPFLSLLDALEHALGQETPTVGAIIDVLGVRGHGPIIALLATLMILPLGMIPFMPAIAGIALALSGLALAIGDERVSLPGWLRRVKLPPAPLLKALPTLRRAADRLSRVIRPRGLWILEIWLVEFAIALCLALVGGVIIVFGAIPGLPFLLCLPVLLLGLGMTAGDGWVTALAVAAILGIAASVIW